MARFDIGGPTTFEVPFDGLTLTLRKATSLDHLDLLRFGLQTERQDTEGFLRKMLSWWVGFHGEAVDVNGVQIPDTEANRWSMLLASPALQRAIQGAIFGSIENDGEGKGGSG